METTKDQTIATHYPFTGQPSFPVVGKVYSDSIDWVKSKVDPYSLNERHTPSGRSQVFSDKIREPSSKSAITYSKKR